MARAVTFCSPKEHAPAQAKWRASNPALADWLRERTSPSCPVTSTAHLRRCRQPQGYPAGKRFLCMSESRCRLHRSRTIGRAGKQLQTRPKMRCEHSGHFGSSNNLLSATHTGCMAWRSGRRNLFRHGRTERPIHLRVDNFEHVTGGSKSRLVAATIKILRSRQASRYADLPPPFGSTASGRAGDLTGAPITLNTCR